MDLLPLAPAAATETEEPEGEFVPCQFSSDEESDDELEHGAGCRCPLCTHGDGGTGASHQVLQQMEDIDRTMAGKVSDKAIWDLQANLYAKHVTEPLARQGIKAPVVTPDDCRKHFSRHRVNPKRIIGEDIKFISTMQKQFRRSQILSRNTHTGETKMNTAAVRQWTALSKHKLDLIKYYNNTLSKDDGKGTTTSTPYTFT
jgi:hypothetical protein